MSFANKFNKTSFGIDTTEFKFVKLADLYKANGEKHVYPINGCYVHKAPLGDSPVIINSATQQLVNLPTHLATTIRDIMSDPEAVEAIKAGKAGFTIYTYESHRRKCYSITFVDR